MTQLVDLTLISQPADLFFIPCRHRRPIEGRASTEEWDLTAIENALTTELQHRNRAADATRGSRGRDATLTWLKNALYQLIPAWMAADRWEELLNHLDEKGRLVRGTKSDRNVFQFGTAGFLAETPGIIKDRDRDRLAARMWQGFRHYIPPAFLDGFNTQYPSHRSADKVSLSKLEKPLYEWVIERRTITSIQGVMTEQHRGSYPLKIEREVERRVALHWEHERRTRRSNTQVSAKMADDEWG